MLSKDNVKTIAPYLGQTILSVELKNDEDCRIIVDNPLLPALNLADHGQDCCETRWMSTDDDLAYYAGATLLDITVDPIPNTDPENGDVLEIAFLRIHTDRGIIVFANHNAHNGFYGGFSITATTR
jgi:hypothetical protein